MTTDTKDLPAEPDQFVRLPGLFRRWEIERVLEPGTEFHLEEAGAASDGQPLFAVYRRELNQKEQ